jgi:hypothetical protein
MIRSFYGHKFAGGPYWGKCMAALLVLSASGCGGEPRGFVSGRVVRHDGTPLQGGVIMARAESIGKSASAQTDANGNYSLGVAQAADGVTPGEYAVVVMEKRMGLDGGGNSTIPARYGDFAQSGLSLSIADGETKMFDIKLESQ